eukprot:scaffold92080_cov21-Prasinocladus_malaysianus.AAC.1
METVVQFLEDARHQPDGFTSDLVVLAAVRLLGCFAVEAPAVHGERVASLLPALLQVTGRVDGPAQGTRFLLPLLSACVESTAKEPDKVAPGLDAEDREVRSIIADFMVLLHYVNDN